MKILIIWSTVKKKTHLNKWHSNRTSVWPCSDSVPFSHLELYWAVRSGGMPPKLRYMTGSRPEKSITVAAYSSPLSVTTAVELWRGSYGQRATPFTLSSTLLKLPTWMQGTETGGALNLQPFHCVSRTAGHTHNYLSGDTTRLESIGSARYDLRLVHQQDSDVVLTFGLQRRRKGENTLEKLK